MQGGLWRLNFFLLLFWPQLVYISDYTMCFLLLHCREEISKLLWSYKLLVHFFKNYQITSLGPRTCMNFYNSKHTLYTYTKNATKVRLMMALWNLTKNISWCYCNKHNYPKNSAIAETASSKEANVDFMDYAKRIKKDWKRHVYLTDYSSWMKMILNEEQNPLPALVEHSWSRY